MSEKMESKVQSNESPLAMGDTPKWICKKITLPTTFDHKNAFHELCCGKMFPEVQISDSSSDERSPEPQQPLSREATPIPYDFPDPPTLSPQPSRRKRILTPQRFFEAFLAFLFDFILLFRVSSDQIFVERKHIEPEPEIEPVHPLTKHAKNKLRRQQNQQMIREKLLEKEFASHFVSCFEICVCHHQNSSKGHKLQRFENGIEQGMRLGEGHLIWYPLKNLLSILICTTN